MIAAGTLTCLPLSFALAGDAAQGEHAARKCRACHDLTENGPNKVGPPLFGVVGRPVASHEGYRFSAALNELGANGLTWTPETLADYLRNPRNFAPGTSMAFAGIRSQTEMDDLVAYLISLSPDYAPARAIVAPPPPPLRPGG